MAQTPSPRNKMVYHEPVSPPENQQQNQQHFYQPQAQITTSAVAATNEQRNRQFVMECYVKNRIVEAMRTTDAEKRGLEQQNHHKEKEERGSPGDMVIDEERPQSAGEKKEHPNMFQGRPGSQPHHQQFQATGTYAYPYSALNVSAGAPITISAKANAESLDSRPNPMMESKPLLSAKYEALSDEDD